MTTSTHIRRVPAAVAAVVAAVAIWQLAGDGISTGAHPAAPATCELRSVSPVTPDCP